MLYQLSFIDLTIDFIRKMIFKKNKIQLLNYNFDSQISIFLD